MKKSFILVKLGGSSITDKAKPYTARTDIISRLAKEIKKSKKTNLIIAHGSGSFGHVSAVKFGGKRGYKTKIGISTVCTDASRINQIVTDIFIEVGLPIVSFSPKSMILSESGKHSSDFFKVIDEVLKQGLIPLVYGDVIWDKEWKSTIFSGEKTLNLLALYLKRKGFKIEKIIQVGETAGVLDKNGNTIPLINKDNWPEIKKNIFKTKNMDVTGGIEHKIEEALDLSKKGIKTSLISHSNNNLFNLMLNRNMNQTLIN